MAVGLKPTSPQLSWLDALLALSYTSTFIMTKFRCILFFCSWAELKLDLSYRRQNRNAVITLLLPEELCKSTIKVNLLSLLQIAE